MQGPLQFNAANEEVIQQYAEDAGKFDSNVNFFTFAKDTMTMFYLLPSWSAERKLIAREIWEMFLPNKRRWTAWRSWDYLNPEFGANDPVVAFYNHLSQLPNVDMADLKRHSPKARFYANVLVTGTKKLPTGDFQAFEKGAEVQTLNMPSTVWNEICAMMQKPGLEAPYDPNRAICFQVSRTGSGLSTEYKVQPVGSYGPTGDVTPTRYNLAEHFGHDTMVKILSELPDLDAQWSPPKTGDSTLLMRANEAKEAFKNKFMTTNFDPATVGAQSVEGGIMTGQQQAQPTSTPPQAPPPPMTTISPNTVQAQTAPPTAPSVDILTEATQPSVQTQTPEPTSIPQGLQVDIPVPPEMPQAPSITNM